MRKKRFIINVFIMSSSMLFLRIAGMITNIYISAKAGASAMGLYHMIFSLFTFGITFASAGTGFAVTRLVAEKKAHEGSIIRKCLTISLIMSFLGFMLFFIFAPFAEKYFIKSPGSANALRLLAFALPCMASSSVYRGYFIAKRKATLITRSTIFEESVCIVVTLLFLNRLANTPMAYMSLVYGCCASNFAAFIFDTVVAGNCLKNGLFTSLKVKTASVLSICIPVALGSYLRTALIAAENLMIPLQFEKYGVINPVGEYGIIKAMAMSVVMFPTVFIQAFSQMLVPEMSEMNASGRKNGIRHVFSMAISTVMFFSAFIALMLFCHHKVISRSFFKEPGVAYYLGLLSLLAVPMYLDTVADSILKGLGFQNSSLIYNVIDSSLRVLSMLLLMPKLGPVFYIAMLYVSEIFNLTLSLGKAMKVSNIKPDWFGWIVLPFFCAFVAFWFKNPLVQTLIYAILYVAGMRLK